MSLSVLRRSSMALARPLRSNNCASPALIVKRMSGHHHMEIKPSSFAWDKIRDMWHLLICGCTVFYGSIILYANIFIGPAQLAEIPEGYEPKHWEYYKHPITRFIQKNFYESPQESYERTLNHIYNEHIKYNLRMLDLKIQALIKERKDYQAYYFKTVPADFIDYEKEMLDVSERYSSEIDDGF